MVQYVRPTKIFHFSRRLRALVGGLGCHACFDALYTAMPTAASGPCDAPYSDACKLLLVRPLEAFAVCTGGISLTMCFQQFEESFYYYRAIVGCAGQAYGSVDFISCLSDTMHRTIVLKDLVGCLSPNCLDDLAGTIASVTTITSCNLGNEYSSECMGIFTTALNQYDTCIGDHDFYSNNAYSKVQVYLFGKVLYIN